MSQPSTVPTQQRERDSDLESVASLPESGSSSDIDSDDGEESDADREWHESLKQLELLLTMVLVPYLGKYFGRKAAYWCEYRGCQATNVRVVTSGADQKCSFLKVHTMEISRQRGGHKSRSLQRRRRSRSGIQFMIVLHRIMR